MRRRKRKCARCCAAAESSVDSRKNFTYISARGRRASIRNAKPDTVTRSGFLHWCLLPASVGIQSGPTSTRSGRALSFWISECRRKPLGHAAALAVRSTRRMAQPTVPSTPARSAPSSKPGEEVRRHVVTVGSGSANAPPISRRTRSAPSMGRLVAWCPPRWSTTSCRTKAINVCSGPGLTGSRCAKRATTRRPRARMVASATHVGSQSYAVYSSA
jgi:hypothetical protein